MKRKVPYNPTPQEIERQAALIRSKWTDRDFINRSAYPIEPDAPRPHRLLIELEPDELKRNWRRLVKVKIKESGMTVAGKIIRAGDTFDVMRTFHNGLGELRYCLGIDGVVILPNTNPNSVEEVDSDKN